MPPAMREREVILTYLDHMAFKVAAGLRRCDLVTQVFFIGLRADLGWLGDHYRSETPIDEARPRAGLRCKRPTTSRKHARENGR
jgi:DNA polymerase-4